MILISKQLPLAKKEMNLFSHILQHFHQYNLHIFLQILLQLYPIFTKIGIFLVGITSRFFEHNSNLEKRITTNIVRRN
jgi:hypothetical protein